MPNRLSYSEDQLRDAISKAKCWSDVMEAIGKPRGRSAHDVRKVAARLGFDTSHFYFSRSTAPIPAPPSLFTRPAAPGHRSSVAIAARWFMERNYVASVPLEVAPYDLVVESDRGLQRVQVKTSSHVNSNGVHVAGIGRMAYDPNGRRFSHGRARIVPYTAEEIDLFFIVTTTGPLYLIPVESAGGRLQLTLEPKYGKFRVD
ncbi:group I intron-associated PD-(D/E)XK endonuclease [Micromonospora sp. DT47]|uniref:group I intron-associated PD-(D/E)XK endonuclease n=1 Tax=Micromonospora sp. DT47 TaxID=3393431 RepID=UPI003CF93DD9